MEIRVAKTAGFCFGVERAVNLALQTGESSDRPVFTYGELVHNEQVIRDLQEKHVEPILEDRDLSKAKGGKVIIRAHGISRKAEEELRFLGAEILDATCPFVKKIHRIVAAAGERGEAVVIFGDPDHPEVLGIAGWCSGPYLVLRGEEDLSKLGIFYDKRIKIVAQTTFNHKKYEKLVAKIKSLGYNADDADTICSATFERQQEAEKLASSVDVMLVVGSRKSSNTSKLYDICKEKCNHTYFIQERDDLKKEWFRNIRCVGITAGASTPKKNFKEVQNDVRRFWTNA